MSKEIEGGRHGQEHGEDDEGYPCRTRAFGPSYYDGIKEAFWYEQVWYVADAEEIGNAFFILRYTSE